MIFFRGRLPAAIALSAALVLGEIPGAIADVTPVIASQPQSRTVFQGATVTFGVTLQDKLPSGSRTFYHWLFNNRPITGATNITLTLTDVQPASAGAYAIVIWYNQGGFVHSTLSSNALLTVLVPPAITVQPVSQTALTGDNVEFTVTATGSAPLTYQWRFNGSPLAGQTNATLLLANVQAGDEGDYSVRVINAAGNVTSLSAHLTVLVRPANDDFANRIPLSGTRVTTTGFNRRATSEPGELVYADVGSGKSVWWSWTAATSGPVVVTTEGSRFDTVLGIYTGENVPVLTHVETNDEEPFGAGTSRLKFHATAGTAYQIAVNGFAGQEGAVVLNLEAGPPENVHFTTPFKIVGSNFAAVAHNFGVSNEPVWWTWTAPASGGVEVTSQNSPLATFPASPVVLAVLVGTTPGNLALVSLLPRSEFGARAVFKAEAGVVYQIAAFDTNGTEGFFPLRLQLRPRPPNDDFQNGTPITGTNVIVRGNMTGATTEPGEPGFGGGTGLQSIWWTWTASADGPVNLSTRDSDVLANVAVYTGSSVSNLTRVVEAHQDACVQIIDYPLSNSSHSGRLSIGVDSAASFDASAGTTYHIALSETLPAAGPVVLRLLHQTIRSQPSPPHPNDNFAQRIALTGTTIFVEGDNRGASLEPGEPRPADAFGSRSVWWSWTAPASGGVTLTSDEGFQKSIAVFTGGTLSNLVAVASSAGITAPRGGAFSVAVPKLAPFTRLTFDAQAGTPYQIALDGSVGESGPISWRLVLRASPANDDFANRTVLQGGGQTVASTSRGATGEPGEKPTVLQGLIHVPAKSVWWSWTAPASGPVSITTEGSDFTTLLAVYTGMELTNLVPVAVHSSLNGKASRVVFDALTGQTYQISVDGLLASCGNVVLSIQPFTRPPNDDFASRIPLQAPNLSVTGFTVGASAEPGEPDARGHSVWYTWTADCTCWVSVETSFFAHRIYTGDSLATLNRLPDNLLQATAGTPYHIAVDEAVDRSFTLSLHRWPSVQVVAPTNGQTFLRHEPVPIRVEAVGYDGTVTNLVLSLRPLASRSISGFVVRRIELGRINGTQLNVVWTPDEIGDYVLEATAQDDFGYLTRANPVPVSVRQVFGVQSVAIQSRSTNSDNTISFQALVNVLDETPGTRGPLRARLVAFPVVDPGGGFQLPYSAPTQIELAAAPLVRGANFKWAAELRGRTPRPELFNFTNIQPPSVWQVAAVLEEKAGVGWIERDRSFALFGRHAGFPCDQDLPGGGVIRIDQGEGDEFNPVALTSVKVNGPDSVNEGTRTPYSATALFNNGVSQTFSMTDWTASRFAIDGNGVFAAGNVSSNVPVTLTCSYVFNNVTNARPKDVTVLNLPPPFLGAVQTAPGAPFQLDLRGVPGRQHAIEVNTNLNNRLGWVPLSTNAPDANGRLQFTDPPDPARPQRFYRALELE